MEIRVIRIHLYRGHGRSLAVASVAIPEAGITVNGMRVYENRYTGEPLVRFPHQKDEAGELFPSVTIWNRRLAAAVRLAVVAAYEDLMANQLEIAP